VSRLLRRSVHGPLAKAVVAFAALLAFLGSWAGAIGHTHGPSAPSCCAHDEDHHGLSHETGAGEGSPQVPSEDHEECALCRVLSLQPSPAAMPPPLPVLTAVLLRVFEAHPSAEPHRVVREVLPRGPPPTLFA
jgi:DUF2946 family protein